VNPDPPMLRIDLAWRHRTVRHERAVKVS